jgi:hypothetical protein
MILWEFKTTILTILWDSISLEHQLEPTSNLLEFQNSILSVDQETASEEALEEASVVASVVALAQWYEARMNDLIFDYYIDERIVFKL